MGRTLAGVALAVLAACTQITTPPTPESARVALTIPGTSEQVRQRIVSAMQANGLTVKSADPTVITSVPIEIASAVMAVYRATILPMGDSVQVTVSGGVLNYQGATVAGATASTASIEC